MQLSFDIRKKELTVEKIKVNRAWVCRYTLEPHMIEATKAANDEPYDKLNPFDVRNAKGIFTKSEYAVMNNQARNFYKGNPNFTKEITNNQFIWVYKVELVWYYGIQLGRAWSPNRKELTLLLLAIPFKGG